MSENFRDELHVILGKKTPSSVLTGSSRLENDDLFVKKNLDSCQELFQRTTLSAEALERFQELNPNDPFRISSHSTRDFEFFENIFKDSLTLYRKAALKRR